MSVIDWESTRDAVAAAFVTGSLAEVRSQLVERLDATGTAYDSGVQADADALTLFQAELAAWVATLAAAEESADRLARYVIVRGAEAAGTPFSPPLDPLPAALAFTTDLRDFDARYALAQVGLQQLAGTSGIKLISGWLLAAHAALQQAIRVPAPQRPEPTAATAASPALLAAIAEAGPFLDVAAFT